MDLTTIGVALIGMGVGLIPYAASWLKSVLTGKKLLLDIQNKVLLQLLEAHKDQVILAIDDKFNPSNNIHGLNPDDIECKCEIEQELEKLRTYCGATRVTVWAFHNGSFFTTGNPQRKLTTVFEAMPPTTAIKSEYDLIQGELLLGFSCVLRDLTLGAILDKGGCDIRSGMRVFSACEKCPLFKNCEVAPQKRPRHCILRCDIDQMPMGNKFFRVMKQLGTKVWYGHAVCNELGLPVGVMTIQFNEYNEASERLIEHSMQWCESCQRLKDSLQYLHDLN